MNEREIFAELYKKGLIKTLKHNPEGWHLVSGMWSPFYIQLRLLPSHPHLMNEIGIMLGEKIKKCGNKLLGIAMAGIPIATAVSLIQKMPLCYTRKIAGVKSIESLKEYASQYGEHSLVEGEIEDGDRFIAIDDIVTKFDSKLIAIKQLEIEAERRGKKIECKNVAVVIDRQQGAEEIAKEYGVKLHSLIKFRDAIEWIKDEMDEKEYEIIVDYLNEPEKYQ
ncbi:MAG TPA: hypothetical protein ENI33_07340 [Thermoplasmatales archaeon]|nr:hypothetical protein [Thermoplasmatales archaeon]